ncbi:hypothetical protein ACX1C1_10305 [Paenibacillus sp. strain BS8-2]
METKHGEQIGGTTISDNQSESTDSQLESDMSDGVSDSLLNADINSCNHAVVQNLTGISLDQENRRLQQLPELNPSEVPEAMPANRIGELKGKAPNILSSGTINATNVGGGVNVPETLSVRADENVPKTLSVRADENVPKTLSVRADENVSVKLSGEHKMGLPNMTLSGLGKAAGGEYGNVQIDGVTKVFGHLSAAYGMRASGVSHVYGSVYAPEMRCEGKVTVDGDTIVRRMYVDGMCKIGGRIVCDSMKLDGLLTAGGDIEAETFISRGAVKTGGLLNAGTIEIGLAHKTSKIREIGGETVIVRRLDDSRWGWLWNWVVPNAESRLDAELIEGDIVRLEYTHADVVRGGQIVIGKGCRIGKVEYRTSLTVHPEGIVEKGEKYGG